MSAPNRRQKPEFIRLLEHYMLDLDVDNPKELTRMIRGRGPNGGPSYPTVSNYFRGSYVPKWFVAVIATVLMGSSLTEEQAYKLKEAYLRSYASDIWDALELAGFGAEERYRFIENYFQM